jgi:aryl-alcohol dehydrogenase-like predicted oxidoreductase
MHTTPLPTATLGRTGLKVTRLGFGCALWKPDMPHWTPEQAQTVWDAALDAGINFFDTAYDYVFSEEWIGWALHSRYDDFYLATKCGCNDTRPTSNNSDHEWTRDNLFRNIEISLGRLNRDSVDIIQLHNATAAECEAGGLVQALSDIRDQGMVRWIGASTTLPNLPTLLSWGVFDVMQIPYSALQREHEDWIAKAAQDGVGIIIRGGVAQGEHGLGTGSSDTWKTFDRASLGELLEEGESRSAFVLRYTFSHPNADTIIVGTTRAAHLQENIDAAMRGPLLADVYTEAKCRLDAAGESPAPVD